MRISLSDGDRSLCGSPAIRMLDVVACAVLSTVPLGASQVSTHHPPATATYTPQQEVRSNPRAQVSVESAVTAANFRGDRSSWILRKCSAFTKFPQEIPHRQTRRSILGKPDRLTLWASCGPQICHSCYPVVDQAKRTRREDSFRLRKSFGVASLRR